ncbi:MAG: TetR family transcriptional regulator [Mycobacterium sp.]|nr:MAG: TetR family transcriptional regulator [Mycobacterium sp.]
MAVSRNAADDDRCHGAPPRLTLHYYDVVFITVARQSISKRGSRAYRSELRQRQAEQTRARVLAAAADLFADHGYARTTLAKIADAAGVSPETVQIHGPKAALFIAAVEYAAFGLSAEENVLKMDVGRRIMASRNSQEALDHLVAAQTDIHLGTARIAPALIGAATSDPEVDRYYKGLTASINGQIRRILGVARDRGWLREDLPFDEIVETTAVIGSIDTYLRLTGDGWTSDRYARWCRRMLAENVFR